MLAIQTMIARRPAKTPPTSTTGFANKEEATIMAGVTNPDHHSKVIRILIPIIIQTNLHSRIWC
jgi:hypothetical protein